MIDNLHVLHHFPDTRFYRICITNVVALILRGGGGEGRGEKVPIGTERKDERKKKRECMQMCFFFTLARADNPFITCNAEKEKRKEKRKLYQYFIPTPPIQKTIQTT